MLEGMAFMDYYTRRTVVLQPKNDQRIRSMVLYGRKRKSLSDDDSKGDDTRNLRQPAEDSLLISSPMDNSDWNWKELDQQSTNQVKKSFGRGRAVKRSNMYQQLSSYHSTFLELLTTEYRAEVRINCTIKSLESILERQAYMLLLIITTSSCLGIRGYRTIKKICWGSIIIRIKWLCFI